MNAKTVKKQYTFAHSRGLWNK